MSDAALPGTGFWRRFLPVWIAGLAGVASLLMQAPAPALLRHHPELRELSPIALRLLLIANPLLLVTLFAGVGAAVAHRVHLVSRLAGTQSRIGWGVGIRAVVIGAALGVMLMLVDAVIAPAIGPDWAAYLNKANSGPWLGPFVLGAFYGGIAEEVTLRWGLMSLIVWILARVTHEPRAWSYVLAAVLAGLIFGAGHLPAIAQDFILTTPLVTRTLVLNLAGSLVFGLIFWRQGLEAAVLAHVGTHLAMAGLRWAA